MNATQPKAIKKPSLEDVFSIVQKQGWRGTTREQVKDALRAQGFDISKYFAVELLLGELSLGHPRRLKTRRRYPDNELLYRAKWRSLWPFA